MQELSFSKSGLTDKISYARITSKKPANLKTESPDFFKFLLSCHHRWLALSITAWAAVLFAIGENAACLQLKRNLPLFFGFDNSLGSRKFRLRNSERRARNIVQANFMTEFNTVRIPAMFAANSANKRTVNLLALFHRHFD